MQEVMSFFGGGFFVVTSVLPIYKYKQGPTENTFASRSARRLRRSIPIL